MSDDKKIIMRGSKAGEEPGPTTCKLGDVAFVPAFPGGFVIHTEDEAYAEAEKWRQMATVCIYRIEIIDVLEKTEKKA